MITVAGGPTGLTVPSPFFSFELLSSGSLDLMHQHMLRNRRTLFWRFDQDRLQRRLFDQFSFRQPLGAAIGVFRSSRGRGGLGPAQLWLGDAQPRDVGNLRCCLPCEPPVKRRMPVNTQHRLRPAKIHSGNQILRRWLGLASQHSSCIERHTFAQG